MNGAGVLAVAANQDQNGSRFLLLRPVIMRGELDPADRRWYTLQHSCWTLQHSCWMVQGSSSWPLWVDATDLCCLSHLMMKDDGICGDNWNYKTCQAPVKSSPPTNQHPAFYRPDALPVAKPTASKHWRENTTTTTTTNFGFLFNCSSFPEIIPGYAGYPKGLMKTFVDCW